MSPDTLTLRLPGLPDPLQLAVHDARDRVVSATLRRDGIWEPFETALVAASLGSGDVFVDVGANLGYFSLLAAARVGPTGQVIAFEPDPLNCSRFRTSLALNRLEDRVVLEEAALAADEGSGELFLSEENLGDHQVYPGEESRARVSIRLLRGDAYLGPRVARIDLVKIDTQGSECRVLEGLFPLLAQQQPVPRLLVELTPFSLRQAGDSGRGLIETLAGLGAPFWIVDHIEHRLVPSSAAELAAWSDGVDACTGDQGFMNIFVGAAPDTWAADAAGRYVPPA